MAVNWWRAWGMYMPPLPFGEHALRSVARWLHSTHPYGTTKYDFRFTMIDVVPFEMINDEFCVAVVWPTTIAHKRNDSFRNDRWPSFWYEYDFLFDIKWLSLRNDDDYPFDRATVSLRPQAIKKLLPGEAKKVACVRAFWDLLKAPMCKTRINTP